MKPQNEIIPQNQAGFSLMEVLVGIFLLSVVSVMTTMIMSGYFKGDEVLEENISRLQSLAKSRQIMRDDLMHFVKRPGFSLPKNETDDKDQIILQFMRTGAMEAVVGLEYSPLQNVEYRLRDQNLIRRTYRRPNPTEKTAYTDYILLKDLTALHVKYFVASQWISSQTDPRTGGPAANLDLIDSDNLIDSDPEAIEFQWHFKSAHKKPHHNNQRTYHSLFRLGASS